MPLPFEHPKLAVLATLRPTEGLAERLEAAIPRIVQARGNGLSQAHLVRPMTFARHISSCGLRCASAFHLSNIDVDLAFLGYELHSTCEIWVYKLFIRPPADRCLGRR